MTLSVRLSAEEESLLEMTAHRLGRSKSELARQAVHELCQRLIREEQSSYTMGKDLFDKGCLSVEPTDPLKQEIWKKLHVKHGYMG